MRIVHAGQCLEPAYLEKVLKAFGIPSNHMVAKGIEDADALFVVQNKDKQDRYADETKERFMKARKAVYEVLQAPGQATRYIRRLPTLKRA